MLSCGVQDTQGGEGRRQCAAGSQRRAWPKAAPAQHRPAGPRGQSQRHFPQETTCRRPAGPQQAQGITRSLQIKRSGGWAAGTSVVESQCNANIRQQAPAATSPKKHHAPCKHHSPARRPTHLTPHGLIAPIALLHGLITLVSSSSSTKQPSMQAHMLAARPAALAGRSSSGACLPRQRRTMVVTAAAGPAIMVNSCTGKVRPKPVRACTR